MMTLVGDRGLAGLDGAAEAASLLESVHTRLAKLLADNAMAVGVLEGTVRKGLENANERLAQLGRGEDRTQEAAS